MKSSTLNTILSAAGGAVLIAAGIASFFINGAAISTISTILAVVALVAGIILLITRITEKKNGGALRLDFVLWFILALLLFNTNILNSIGSIIVVIIAVFLIIEGAASLKNAVGTSAKEISKIIFACLFIVGGVFALLNARMVFNEVIGKVIGVYLVIQGANMLRDFWGQVKYNRNFKGVE